MTRSRNISGLAPAVTLVALCAWAPTANATALLPEPASLRSATLDGLLMPSPTPPPPAPPAKPPASESGGEQRVPTRRTVYAVLSNERTRSRWAFVERTVTARRKPTSHSRRVKRLRFYTRDGTPEVVLVLWKATRPDGHVWLKVRLPMRPNGRTGWLPRSALGRLHTVHTFLLIRRRHFRASLFRRGKRIWSSRLGVGKRGTSTPSGDFYVRERLIPAKGNTIYGVFAFGTSAYSATLTDWPGGGVVGIHGTNQPELIPGRISHGCIRVRNGPIRRLRRLMPLGTPIRID